MAGGLENFTDHVIYERYFDVQWNFFIERIF